jgi:hypothetical protein
MENSKLFNKSSVECLAYGKLLQVLLGCYLICQYLHQEKEELLN